MQDQRNYIVTEQEYMAAVDVVRDLRAYVEGTAFKVLTDHSPSLKTVSFLKTL